MQQMTICVSSLLVVTILDQRRFINTHQVVKLYIYIYYFNLFHCKCSSVHKAKRTSCQYKTYVGRFIKIHLTPLNALNIALAWKLKLDLPMQSAPITTKVVEVESLS